MQHLNYTTEDGTRLALRCSEGDGPPVLLIHGWMMSGAVYSGIAEDLEQAGYNVIVPDLRGAGESAPSNSDYSLATFAADMIAILDHLGIERCDLIGHSMGGQIAQLVSVNAPGRVRSQVLVCPVPASGLPLPDDAAGMFRSAAGNPETLQGILSMATTQLSEADLSRLIGYAMTVTEPCLQNSLDSWMAGGFAERLGETRAKTLVIASEDPFLPPEFLREAVVDPIPDASIEVIMGAGHYVQVEQREASSAVIVDFLHAVGA